jgi:hypothetical protein
MAKYDPVCGKSPAALSEKDVQAPNATANQDAQAPQVNAQENAQEVTEAERSREQFKEQSKLPGLYSLSCQAS